MAPNPGGARRAARALAETPRGHGGADRRPAAARQGGHAHRGQHGRGGVLRLCAARRQRAGALRHRGPEGELGAPRDARRRPRPRRHDRRGGARRSTFPTRSRIPPSPTCRRRARRSTTPSSACRCSAPGARSACSSCRTAPTASTRRRSSRRCRRPRWCSPRCSPPARWKTSRCRAPISTSTARCI